MSEVFNLVNEQRNQLVHLSMSVEAVGRQVGPVSEVLRFLFYRFWGGEQDVVDRLEERSQTYLDHDQLSYERVDFPG